MQNAESIFASYIARVEAGETIDFDAFCKEHAGNAEKLRELKASCEMLGPILRANLGGSVSKSIREVHGSEVDPNVELEADKPVSQEDFSSEVLRRLSDHAGGYGRYKIRGEVARGGQGAVLRVWDEDLRRNLAMKVILGSGNASTGDTPNVDPKTLGRFLEEAQVTGQLDHPGIVPVHELGLDSEGQVYFTMKLVKGETFKDVIEKVHRDEDGWTMTRTLGVLLKVCEAMSYTHDKGVIHRDLKPANIMVGRFGEVYVMDWGLARVLGKEDAKDIRIKPDLLSSKSEVRTERRNHASNTPDSPLYTMDGDVVGTPAYMSPEQAQGWVSEMGPPSDVYAVGAILYHLLAGHMPYLPPSANMNAYAIWNLVQQGPPKSIAQIATTAPSELVAICEKAMAREPAERYSDMGGLASDLRAFMENRVVQAYRTGTVVELRKWVGRNRSLAFASIAAVVLLVVGLFSSLFLKSLADDAAADARLAAEEEFVARRLAERQSYALRIRAAEMSLDADQVADAHRILASVQPQDRRFEWGLTSLRADQSLEAHVQHNGRVFCVAWSPDGSRLATGGQDARLVVWDAAEFSPIRSLQLPRSIHAMAWSGDGRRLAAGGLDGDLHLFDSDTWEPEADLEGHTDMITSVAWSPDCGVVATASADGTVRLWSLDSPGVPVVFEGIPAERKLEIGSREFPAPEEWVWSVAWSADGQHLALGGSNGTLQVRQPDGRIRREVVGHVGRVDALAWSPVGDRLASSGADGVVRLWGEESPEPVELGKHEGPATSVAWSPRGERLISAGEDGWLRVWDTAGLTEIGRLRGHESLVRSVAWSPDGERVVSVGDDETLRIWLPTNCPPGNVLARHVGPVSAAAWSKDGSRLATAGWDGGILLQDAHPGAFGARLDEGGTYCWSLAWSSDGSRLASGGSDGLVRIWDPVGKEVVVEMHAHEGEVRCVAWSADGMRLASGGRDGMVRLWNPSSGASIGVAAAHSGSVTDLLWREDDVGLYSCGQDGAIRSWEPSSSEPTVLVEGLVGEVGHLSPGPEKQPLQFVTHRDGRVLLCSWGPAGVSEGPELIGHGVGLGSTTWSADGQRIASGDKEGVIRVWDVSGGEPLVRVVASDERVGVMAWSPAGSRLVAGCRDGTVLVWDSSLENARAVWKWSEYRRRLVPLLDALFEEEILLQRVEEILGGDPTLTDEERAIAISMARDKGNPSSASLLAAVDTALRTARDKPSRAEEDLQLAYTLAQSAFELFPDDLDVLGGLGRVQLRKGMGGEATRTLARARVLNDQREEPVEIVNLFKFKWDAYIYGAWVEGSSLEEYERELSYAEAYHELFPNDVAGIQYLGMALYRLKRFELAGPVFEQAINMGGFTLQGQTSRSRGLYRWVHVLSSAAVSHAEAGDVDSARARIRELRAFFETWDAQRASAAAEEEQPFTRRSLNPEYQLWTIPQWWEGNRADVARAEALLAGEDG